jgi:hypothetical protein
MMYYFDITTASKDPKGKDCVRVDEIVRHWYTDYAAARQAHTAASGVNMKGDVGVLTCPANAPAAAVPVPPPVSRESDPILFGIRVNDFMLRAQELIEAHYKASGFLTTPPTLKRMDGFKYTRIVREGPGERSAYCFIDIKTGDVLKAASWMAPAKGARANIWSSDFGMSGLTPHGARYL